MESWTGDPILLFGNSVNLEGLFLSCSMCNVKHYYSNVDHALL